MKLWKTLAALAHFDDAAVDEFDGADIDAACRLADDENTRVLFHFPRQHDLLLVAAGEIRRLQARITGPYVVFLDLVLGVGHARTERWPSG